jgi:tRNA U34 5-methylaminomethyl-2-thiouridine-forming methyltransferase MnmC
VDAKTIEALADVDGLPESSENMFRKLHAIPWDEKHQIAPGFYLTKIKSKIEIATLQTARFNLVYFDAFGPDVQPEMWTEGIFKRISGWMISGGILTTYSAKGEVRRNLKKTGFNVERIAGPPGKRHMTRAFCI